MLRDRHLKYDVVIVGGGHNGLVCACYLAGSGLKVRVLERRPIVGGAAVTQTFHPGFRNSTLAYTVSLLDPDVIRDLRLVEHGLEIVERPFANFLPLPDGDSFRVGPDTAATQAELARFSRRDAERLPEYYRMIGRIADLLLKLARETPPRLAGGHGGLDDLLEGWRLGRQLYPLDLAARRDLLELFTRSAGALLDSWFESDPIKAALGFDAVVGNFASPYAAGSGYVLLHHCFGEVNGQRGKWGHAIGGMGAITRAMAREARARGVEITTEAEVQRVLVEDNRTAGVRLTDGTQIEARSVASNVEPSLFYLHLLGPDALEGDFRTRMQRWRLGSGSLRINLALAELPDFVCAPGTHAQPHHGAGIIMAPSLGYMDRAWVDAKQHGWARAPIVEMLIPSTVDTTLAPAGAHVASLFCQHFSPELPEGRSWEDAREVAADTVIAVVNSYAPNFAASIIARQVITPLDMESEYGLTRGDIFHGALGLDQLFLARPMLGHGDYRGPISGLYHCGAGAHPGGGVTGIPGRNCAREMLRDFRRRKIR
ncbi:MAG: FAD-dependent oxidoreductase [Betaproteobacteria bacterium RIFCSPLOWO2_02_FULL_63_19]|nr:MAG: FAD-dependent oxidoreductase [Betaproteobacteria bacterium RIFCSPLOWO2_02_FULL_63_19]